MPFWGGATIPLTPLVNPKQWKTISTKDLLDEGYVVYGANGKIGFYNQYTHEAPTIMITCRGATCGNLHISEPYSYINGNAMALDGQPKEFIGIKYLYYVLTARGLSDTISGSAQPQITQQGLNKVKIPLPSVAEQKEIVDRLDTLLAQVEATQARLAHIPDIIKQFRQSVLAAAVSGDLSKDIHPCVDRFHDKYAFDWQWSDIPVGWSVCLYKDLVDSRLGKMLDKAKNIGSPIKYLGNINVRWFGFSTENLQSILLSEKEKEELLIKKGDVLICEGGEPGRCAIWNGNEDIVFQKALHRARTKGNVIPEWLVYNFKNDADNLTLSQLFTGTTIKHLTGKALATYPIRVPPIEEQKTIVRRVEQLFAYADSIEQQAKAAKARVDNLTQAILAKAFRGELTADWRASNPDLISGDHSTAALLARIQAERATAKPRKRASKPTISPTSSGVTQ